MASPFDNIPAELKARKQWVGSYPVSKAPMNARTGGNAMANNPQTWSTYEVALASMAKFGSTGVGYVFASDDPYAGIDLDHSVDEGVIAPWADTIVNTVDSYSELSPSETGIHILCKASLMPLTGGAGCNVEIPGTDYIDADGKPKRAKIEFYDRKHYFRFSGMVMQPRSEILERQNEFARAHALHFPPVSKETQAPAPLPPSTKNDSEIIEWIRSWKNGSRFQALWSGDTGGYPSASEADWALMEIILHAVGPDASRVANLCRQSPRYTIRAKKWDRDPNGDFLIDEARNLIKRKQAYAANHVSTRRNGKAPHPEDNTECTDADLPVIETSNRELKDKSTDGMAALVHWNNPPSIFIFGGNLSRVVTNPAGFQVVQSLNLASFRYCLERSAHWVKTTTDREGKPKVTNVFPPREVVEDIMAYPEWPDIPTVDRIVNAPVVAPDGSISMTPGYHAAGRVYYAPVSSNPIPDTKPTDARVEWAKNLIINEMLVDFPFVDDSSLAHALSLLFTPFLRLLISGPTPIHLLEAPIAGTGKGLLAEALCSPFFAGDNPTAGQPQDDEEWRKAITSNLVGAPSHIIFDNITTALKSGQLARAVTSSIYEDRILGTNAKMSVRVQNVWAVTVNNVEVDVDIARRCVFCRLNANTEDPANSGRQFKIADMKAWLPANSHNITAAALILIRAWIDAGMPQYKGRPLGSFESYSRNVGGLLEFHGFRDFLVNGAAYRERANPEHEVWKAFLEHWYADFYLRSDANVSRLHEIAMKDDLLISMLRAETDRGQKTKLGDHLRKRVDQVVKIRELSAGGEFLGEVEVRIIKTRVVHSASHYALEPVRNDLLIDLPEPSYEKEYDEI